jgi:hypothetical protein
VTAFSRAGYGVKGKNRTPKTISATGQLGQLGVNLIERVVLEMGSRWSPCGPLEVGIDGYIEFFCQSSRRALGRTIAVQSKAVSKFDNENGSSFDYWADRRDIDYWLLGNMPVVLVVSKPDSDEAYWVPIKDYFGPPERRNSTRIHFDKTQDRFDVAAYSALLNLSGHSAQGLYHAPLRQQETLHSNLLRLESFPSRIFLADCDVGWEPELFDKLRRLGVKVSRAWILRDGKLISFQDLSVAPWPSVCEASSMESIDSSSWAYSDDSGEVHRFIELLNQTLREQLHPEVRYFHSEDCFAFALSKISTGQRKARYQSLARSSEIQVVTHRETRSKSGQTFDQYRHSAFHPHFRRFDGQWYLEITPTYRFTNDGSRLNRFHAELLKGIKRIEGNRAVLSAVLMWVGRLKSAPDMFRHQPPLRFGDLLSFESEVGIREENWKSVGSDEDSTIVEGDGDLLLKADHDD